MFFHRVIKKSPKKETEGPSLFFQKVTVEVLIDIIAKLLTPGLCSAV